MVDACSALLHLNIYLYSNGDNGEKLIYFYGWSDFKLHFRSLIHQVAFHLMAPFFTVSLLMFSVKILPGENKVLFFAPHLNVPPDL